MAALTESMLEARNQDHATKRALAAYGAGNDAFDDGDHTAAIAAYDQALAAVPGFVEATYNRATALLLDDRVADALAGFLATLELDPEHAMACSNGCVAALRHRDYQLARTLGRRALELAPDDLDALVNLGNALVHIPELEEARAVAAELDELDPAAAADLRRWIAQPPTPGEPANFVKYVDGERVDEPPGDPLARAYELLSSADEEDAESSDPNEDLVLAVYFGDLARATRALDAGASPDAVQDASGQSVLFLAVSHDQVAIVRLLLERGADPAGGVDTMIDGRRVVISAFDRAHAEGKTEIIELFPRSPTKAKAKAPTKAGGKRAR
jgi:tetratricopeptide (TPR) repeat protein